MTKNMNDIHREMNKMANKHEKSLNLTLIRRNVNFKKSDVLS